MIKRMYIELKDDAPHLPEDRRTFVSVTTDHPFRKTKDHRYFVFLAPGIWDEMNTYYKKLFSNDGYLDFVKIDFENECVYFYDVAWGEYDTLLDPPAVSLNKFFHGSSNLIPFLYLFLSKDVLERYVRSPS